MQSIVEPPFAFAGLQLEPGTGEHVGLDVDHDDVLAVFAAKQRVFNAGCRMAGRLDHDIDRVALDQYPGIIAEFNSRMAEETEGRPLDPDLIGPGVAALLADRGKGRYWVAESDGDVVGQIMVTYEWSDWRNGMLWWIQSVYVREDFRRTGVFSQLYRYVETRARSEGKVAGLRLYVEKNNERAQNVYRSLGMAPTDYRIMQALFDGNRKEENNDVETR